MHMVCEPVQAAWSLQTCELNPREQQPQSWAKKMTVEACLGEQNFSRPHRLLLGTQKTSHLWCSLDSSPEIGAASYKWSQGPLGSCAHSHHPSHIAGTRRSLNGSEGRRIRACCLLLLDLSYRTNGPSDEGRCLTSTPTPLCSS